MLSGIGKLQQFVDASHKIVFFGGAGVSTESGIPDFRSVDGLYHQKYPYPPEIMLSHTFLMTHSDEFFAFYRDKMIYRDAAPNKAHKALAALERAGRLSAVITQNIDGLHQLAGSERVLELHGSVHRNYCVQCHKAYTLSYILEAEGVPKCDCGGMVRPDVVLYEEALDEGVMRGALGAIREADMLIVGGTSLSVYPAAMLANDYLGARLVLINKTPTPMDNRAELVFRTPIGETLDLLDIRGL